MHIIVSRPHRSQMAQAWRNYSWMLSNRRRTDQLGSNSWPKCCRHLWAPCCGNTCTNGRHTIRYHLHKTLPLRCRPISELAVHVVTSGPNTSILLQHHSVSTACSDSLDPTREYERIIHLVCCHSTSHPQVDHTGSNLLPRRYNLALAQRCGNCLQPHPPLRQT